jgi:hypothetical protein
MHIRFCKSISNSLVYDLSFFKIWQNMKKTFSNSLLNLVAIFPHLPSVGAACVYLRTRIRVAIVSLRFAVALPARERTILRPLPARQRTGPQELPRRDRANEPGRRIGQQPGSPREANLREFKYNTYIHERTARQD